MNVTLITGASGGIGEAFARRLAAEKHNLLLVARSEVKLRQLCSNLMATYPIKAHYIAIDLLSPEADQRIVDETKKRNLDVDWLINNAGIGSAGEFSQLDLNSELAMMHLNMGVLVALTHRYLPEMRARKQGTIVNVGSMAGFQPFPFMAVYAASKVFVRSFTQAIWQENRPYNIRTMLLCPGATETGFFDAAKIDSDRKDAYSGGGVLQTPEQVVDEAMRGLKRNKRITISGFRNRLLARLTYLIPNAVSIPLSARLLRPKTG